jgi:hypothetical protein
MALLTAASDLQDYYVDMVRWWPSRKGLKPMSKDYRDFFTAKTFRRSPIKRRGHWIFSMPDGYEPELARLRDP